MIDHLHAIVHTVVRDCILQIFEHLESPMTFETIKNGFIVKFCVDIGPRGSTGTPEDPEC